MAYYNIEIKTEGIAKFSVHIMTANAFNIIIITIIILSS